MKTQKSTMIAMIAELIESHMEKCDDNYPPDAIPHVLSEVHGHSANIEWLANDGDNLTLRLSDGSAFTIQVWES